MALKEYKHWMEEVLKQMQTRLYRKEDTRWEYYSLYTNQFHIQSLDIMKHNLIKKHYWVLQKMKTRHAKHSGHWGNSVCIHEWALEKSESRLGYDTSGLSSDGTKSWQKPEIKGLLYARWIRYSRKRLG